MTVVALSALLLATWPQPQAQAVLLYMEREAGVDRHNLISGPLDPCAYSRLGEGLVGVTGNLRGELHRFAIGQAGASRAGSEQSRSSAHANSMSCIPAQVQIAYLAWAFPLHYPNCAARFAQGDLSALDRCWGKGRGR